MYDPKLETLVHSKYLFERAEAVKQCYGLDVLINDKESCIRLLIAEQGYGLDILVHDNDFAVRQTVAEQGYGLDVLVHDTNPLVRLEVARQGYGLDILVNDENWAVCDEVERQLGKFPYPLPTLYAILAPARPHTPGKYPRHTIVTVFPIFNVYLPHHHPNPALKRLSVARFYGNTTPKTIRLTKYC